MRVKVTLACTECKQRNYNTMKNKKNAQGLSSANPFRKGSAGRLSGQFFAQKNKPF